MTPESMASLDPRGLIGTIYLVDHYTLLHTEYISCGPDGFKDFFKVFPIISLWELMTPCGMASLDPRGLIGRIYEVDHYSLLHTKYIRHMVSEKKIFCFSHYKSMGDNNPRGVANMDPRCMVGRI